MNTEQLTNSISEINDSFINEVDELRQAGTMRRKHVSAKKMLLVPLAAVLMLMLAGFTAYSLSRGKVLLFPGKAGNLTEAKVYFEREDSLIASSEITGRINEVSDKIAKRYQEMGKPSDDDFVPVSMHPGYYNVSFQTYEEAEKYIDYDGLKIPRLDIPGYCEGTNIHILGDENGNIENISVITDYYATDPNTYTLQLIETLFTENQRESDDGTVSIMFSYYSEDPDLKEEKKVVNGREFLIIREDLIKAPPVETEDEFPIVNADVERASKSVFWQENKVIYLFTICYPLSRENEADQMIRKWMNSF